MSVSSSGVVTGVGAGEADVSATYAGLSGSQHLRLVPRTFALAGVISDESTSRAIEGAEVEVIDGENAGKLTRADVNGYYSLPGLLAGNFTLRARAIGYDSGDKRVTLANADVRLDITLRRTVPPLRAAFAVYDPTFKAPVCSDPATSCDSGTLLNGSGELERNQPNTIFNSCPDGAGRGHFAIISAIRVSTLDGSGLASGKTVRVDVTLGGGSTADFARVYVAPDVLHPSWTQLAESQQAFGLLSVQTVLRAGDLQAIRVNFAFGRGFGPGPCAMGSDDDNDDLVFRVQ